MKLSQWNTSSENARFEVFTTMEESGRGLLGCGAVHWCGRIPSFQMTSLPPTSLRPEDGSSRDIRNVSNLWHHYTASQPRI